MKRTGKSNINRNRSIFNHLRNNNLVTPEMLVNQMWMQEEDTSGVKIIELNSSSDSSNRSNSYTRPWSYINNGRFEEREDRYTVNEDARRRRRSDMDHSEYFTAAYAKQYFFDHGMQPTNSFYETYDAEFNSAPINHQTNCFTIINNQHFESDSSTDCDNYDSVQVIELDQEGSKDWDHVYNDEVVTYESNKQPEKRTICIYSYKNKRLLSENDFELLNIQSKDASSASTSCSISDEELKVDKSTTAIRLGSPIPAAYIPKLDLSLVQTLSTVTEISETNKSHSKESSHEVINIKPRNNWLTERSNKVTKVENSNVLNWMALSPRERRRRSINTNSEITAIGNVKETEITHAEGNTQFEESNRSSKIESSTVHVQVDIHANKPKTRDMLVSPKDRNKSDKVKKIADVIPMNISFADADIDTDDINTKLDYSIKPSIQINAKYNKAEITDPIEKLDCNNWITEENVEQETTVYDYDFDGEVNATVSSSDGNVIDSASGRLWMRNLQLMKAPQWNEYLPISCSPRSLHLSLSLGSIDSKKSWFKRFAKCINCCR